MRRYESNGIVKENPFEIELLKENGEMADYYLIDGEIRDKISLSDLVNEQVKSIGYKDKKTFISNGDCAKNASSGDYAQNASSGNYARNASSGNYAKNASSGNNAQNETMGRNSITFDCGFRSISKSVNGTWISLAEYEKIDDKWVPCFALSGQIGNENYKDSLGNTLSENEWYMLINKQFTPIILDDGLKLIKLYSKIMNNIEIIKCKEIDEDDILYCVRDGELSAHGETLKIAISDLQFKKMKTMDKSEIVTEIKSSGFVTREQYRAITGACQYGTEKFAKENGYSNVEKVDLNELLSKLSDNDFGATEFKRLFN